MNDENAYFILHNSDFILIPPAVCFLWHFPSDCSASPLATTAPLQFGLSSPQGKLGTGPSPDSGRDRHCSRDLIIRETNTIVSRM